MRNLIYCLKFVKAFTTPRANNHHSRISKAFTPNLDTYLNSMISGAKTQDNSLRDIQDKILDVLGPLCAPLENFTLMQESKSIENEEIILDKATVDAMFGCVKKAIMLVGDISTQLSSKRREHVLTKRNPVLASLRKEDFPDSGKQLFGDGFESCLKLRSETANTIADAKKPGKSFFRGTALRRFHGRFRGGRGQYRVPYRGFIRPTPSYQTTSTSLRGRSRTPFTQSQGPYQPKPLP